MKRSTMKWIIAAVFLVSSLIFTIVRPFYSYVSSDPAIIGGFAFVITVAIYSPGFILIRYYKKNWYKFKSKNETKEKNEQNCENK